MIALSEKDFSEIIKNGDGKKMNKKIVIREDARIIKNRELNNKILDLEMERHRLAMKIKELEKEIVRTW